MRKLQGSPFGSARQKAPAPVAKRRAETSLHGVTLSDDYQWLKAENWQEVLRDPAALPGDIRAVLEAENDYAAGHARACREIARGARQGDARPDQGR